MRRVSALLLLGCLQTALGWAHVPAGELRKAVSDDDVMVAFVAPDEPASAAFEPEWLSAAAEGKEHLVSIDCGVNQGPDCDREGIESLPFILLFRSGSVVAQYKGPRRAAALLHFAARRKRPVVSESLGSEELIAFKTTDETVFVAYLDPEDRTSAEVVTDAAIRYRDEFSFATVTDSSLAEAQGINVPSVVCYKQIDGDTRRFSSFNQPHEFDDWVKEASRPILGELTALNQQRLLDRGWPMVYLFAPTESERQQLRKTVYKFAKSYYDSLTSVLVDPFQFPELMNQLGLATNQFPAGAVHQLSKDRIYQYPKDKPFSPGALQQWGLDVYQGLVKAWTPPGFTAPESTEHDEL
ncbi:thioredoxin-like domain-containing protein [Lasiosphaeris hirsuta]|uniref:Protein disulfide-isomerase n=1 Tax=Lasiosphaeris hirsuta TaxID=260670 RepID=A0AA40DS05_9PEZI|nr:thioredoxin-like domain-containing protein [Lasiosphaeris hirsuta]